MDWTTDALLDDLRRQAEAGRMRLPGAGTPQQRKLALQDKLKRALGEFPERDRPLNAELLDQRDLGDVTLERYVYSTMEYVQVPVWVLAPKKRQGRLPAVLACHGHGNGQRDAVGLDAEGKELTDAGIHNRFALSLARQGMIVAIPEIMGFGVRRMAGELKANQTGSSCGTLSSQLLLHGRTLAGMRVFEALRGIDYLGSRPDVDPEKIGVFGFSGGGLIAAYASALDERIKATALCGWTNTFAGSILAMHHCIDNYLPGILREAEQPELIGLIAPRALFVESGEKDRIFPVEHVHGAIAALGLNYADWEARGRFSWDIHPGAHEICGRESFGWLYRTLTEGP
ncbi:alpha/beta hydrolase family protein [Paenibacillus sp. CAU 1782]